MLSQATMTFSVSNVDDGPGDFHVSVRRQGKGRVGYCYSYGELLEYADAMSEAARELHPLEIPWLEYLAVRWTAASEGYTGRLMYVPHPNRPDDDTPGLWVGLDA